MSPETDSHPPSLLPLKCESRHPECNWSNAWKLIRTAGLTSELSSFLFKLLHNLLPTQERVRRLGVNREISRGLCYFCNTETENLEHAFFACSASSEAGLTTLGWAQSVVPGLSMEQALHLDTGDSHLGREEELVLTTILGTGLKQIWDARTLKKRITRH